MVRSTVLHIQCFVAQFAETAEFHVPRNILQAECTQLKCNINQFHPWSSVLAQFTRNAGDDLQVFGTLLRLIDQQFLFVQTDT